MHTFGLRHRSYDVPDNQSQTPKTWGSGAGNTAGPLNWARLLGCASSRILSLMRAFSQLTDLPLNPGYLSLDKSPLLVGTFSKAF